MFQMRRKDYFIGRWIKRASDYPIPRNASVAENEKCALAIFDTGRSSEHNHELRINNY